MNTEIKFRQPIRNRHGIFIEWFYWDIKISPAIQQNGIDTRKESQQFTGLQDKKGIDIYEGDKLNYKRQKDSNWAGPNEFDKDYEITVGFKNGSFICEETDQPLYEKIRNVVYNPKEWTSWEVIGNKF
jgi:uncharacterized phage protein (TIGR01671 family)